MRYPARCRKCRARRTLSKHPLDYVREPKCHYCGGEMVVDAHRLVQRRLRPGCRADPGPTCKCDALPGRDGSNMPHRRGSVPECGHYRGER